MRVDVGYDIESAICFNTELPIFAACFLFASRRTSARFMGHVSSLPHGGPQRVSWVTFHGSRPMKRAEILREAKRKEGTLSNFPLVSSLED